MQSSLCSAPPCFKIKKGEDKGRKREKFYIYLNVTHTHTHTRPKPGQPFKAKGSKKRTQTTGKRTEQRRGGGEQTDLQNQSTQRNGPDHPDTLQRGRATRLISWKPVPGCKIVRYSLKRTVVGQPTSGHETAMQIFTNWCTTSQPHQITIKRKKTTPESINLKPLMGNAVGIDAVCWWKRTCF